MTDPTPSSPLVPLEGAEVRVLPQGARVVLTFNAHAGAIYADAGCVFKFTATVPGVSFVKAALERWLRHEGAALPSDTYPVAKGTILGLPRHKFELLVVSSGSLVEALEYLSGGAPNPEDRANAKLLLEFLPGGTAHSTLLANDIQRRVAGRRRLEGEP